MKYDKCNGTFTCAGKFIWPVIGELSAKHPHVTTYKIDIDQVGGIWRFWMHFLIVFFSY